MADSKIKVWLAMDPETRRVLVQDREFDEGSFPRGLRGQSWPQRTTEVSKGTFTKLLRSTMTPGDMDTRHRRWWDQAAGPGEPPWPDLPGRRP